MKRKGSALVVSVLILSFFLAIALNIFFVAMKKGKSAGVKVKGERVTSNIDIASSLGYQELFLAENFVRLGFPYTASHPEHKNSYSTPYSDKVYLDPSTGIYDKKYPGIHLNDFIDYFTSHWDYTIGGSNEQKLIMSEDVTINAFGNKVVESRMWQSGGITNKTLPLWSLTSTASNDKRVSIGGYHLYRLVSNGVSKDIDMSSGSNNPQSHITGNLISGPNQSFSAYYVKFIRLKEDSTLGIPEMNFRVEVEESFSAIRPGSSTTFTDLEFYGRDINNFTIKVID